MLTMLVAIALAGSPDEDRLADIARLEQVVRQHDGITADNLLRLAELYYGQSLATKDGDWLDRSIAGFERVMKEFPAYGRYGEAMYYRALALKDKGSTDEAIRMLETLVRQDPRSPWAPSALTLVGDHQFEAGNMRAAIAAYQQVHDGWPTAREHGYATYKLAWCWYNEGDRAQATALMQAVADLPRGPSDRLREEARKDLKVFRAP